MRGTTPRSTQPPREPTEPATESSPGWGLVALVGQIGDDASFFPLALLHLTIAATVVVIATSLRQPWVPRGRRLAPVFAFDLLGSAALVFFQLATQQGLLTIVSVIAALYPATTVAMAAIFLGETIGRLQSAGLALAATAVVLVAVGNRLTSSVILGMIVTRFSDRREQANAIGVYSFVAAS